MFPEHFQQCLRTITPTYHDSLLENIHKPCIILYITHLMSTYNSSFPIPFPPSTAQIRVFRAAWVHNSREPSHWVQLGQGCRDTRRISAWGLSSHHDWGRAKWQMPHCRRTWLRGYSTVWLALDTHLKRYVAVKINIADSLPHEMRVRKALSAPLPW